MVRVQTGALTSVSEGVATNEVSISSPSFASYLRKHRQPDSSFKFKDHTLNNLPAGMIHAHLSVGGVTNSGVRTSVECLEEIVSSCKLNDTHRLTSTPMSISTWIDAGST